MAQWEQTYEIGANPSVEIDLATSGSVRITGAAGTQARVRASWEGHQPIQEVAVVEARPGRLLVRTLAGTRKWFSFGALTTAVHLELELPPDTRCSVEAGSAPVEISGLRQVEVETGSGGIAVRNVAGAVTLEAGSGSVSVTNVTGPTQIEVGSGSVAAKRLRGDLKAETGSGTLDVDTVEGRVELSTGSGSVLVQRVRGPLLRVESGGGSVTIRQAAVRRAELETGSGGVTAEFAAIEQDGRYRIEAGSGPVTVSVPPMADLRFDLTAPLGRISHEGLQFSQYRQEDGELSAQLGKGGAVLSVETQSGGIMLRAYEGEGGSPPVAPSAASVAPEAPAAPAAPVAPAAPAAPVAQPAPAVPVISAETARAIEADPALSTSAQVRRVVRMVEEGKLTPAEADAILAALSEEADSA